MSGPLDSVTGALVAKALDVSLATHQTIANNIAIHITFIHHSSSIIHHPSTSLSV